MGTLLSFPPFYKKRNMYFDILLAFLDKEVFPEWGILQQNVCSSGANAFRGPHTEIGDKNEVAE